MKALFTAIIILSAITAFSQAPKDSTRKDTVWIAQMPAALYYSLLDDIAIQASGKAVVTTDEWKAILKAMQSSANVFPYVPLKEKPNETKR